MTLTSKDGSVDKSEPVPPVLPVEEPRDDREAEPNDNTKGNDEVWPIRSICDILVRKAGCNPATKLTNFLAKGTPEDGVCVVRLNLLPTPYTSAFVTQLQCIMSACQRRSGVDVPRSPARWKRRSA